MRARAFVLVAALAAVGLPGRAATLCVSPAGSASGVPCYDTIQHAVDASVAAGVINVQAGMYFENVNVPAALDGLQVVGAGKLATTVDADDPNTGPGLVINSDAVVLKNLTIQNGVNDSVRVLANGVVITGVRIVNARHTTGSTGGQCDSSSGSGEGYAIYIGSGYTGTQVLQSEFHSNYCYDVGSDFGGSGNDGTVVTGNVFDNGYYQTVKISGNNVQVLDNKIIANDNAIEVHGNNALIQGNAMDDTNGYIVAIGDQFTIQGNKAANSFAIYGDCTPAAACTGGRISSNVSSGASFQNGGVWSYSNGPGVVMQANKITGAGYYPLYIFANIATPGSVQADANVITGGGVPRYPCVQVYYGTGHSLTGNSVSKCGDTAFYVYGNNVTLDSNKALGGYGNGFWVDGGGGVYSSVTLTGNSASGVIGEGFAVASGAVGTALRGNVASKNRVDFCDEGSGTDTSGGNSFATTGACDILR